MAYMSYAEALEEAAHCSNAILHFYSTLYLQSSLPFSVSFWSVSFGLLTTVLKQAGQLPGTPFHSAEEETQGLLLSRTPCCVMSLMPTAPSSCISHRSHLEPGRAGV